jgi:hypothetical protein
MTPLTGTSSLRATDPGEGASAGNQALPAPADAHFRAVKFGELSIIPAAQGKY